MRLAVEPGREACARADRIGEAPALLDERAATLLAAQHALMHQRGDRLAHRVTVDAEPPRQLMFRRQLARAVIEPAADIGADIVGDLTPERDAVAPFHCLPIPAICVLSPCRHGQSLRRSYNLFGCLDQ